MNDTPINENTTSKWGCHFNECAISRRKKEPLPGCPSCATWRDIETWCEKGIIVWSDISKRIESLSGTRSMELLKKLETSNECEKEGIVISNSVILGEINHNLPYLIQINSSRHA